jgi:hypothetical protein
LEAASEPSKQLQDLHIDASLLSETHLKPVTGSIFQIITFIGLTVSPDKKAELALQREKTFPIQYVNLPPLVSIEATGVCIPIGNSEVLLASAYNSPGHAWNDIDITELLSFRHKSLLAGGLNAKHPFWNSVVSTPSGAKLLNLLHINELEISESQCPTH